MGKNALAQKLTSRPEERPSSLQLSDGSRVAVIGGGPAGSYFSYFLLNMADMLDMDLQVDVYEPRDYGSPGPKGCNMCGGIVSESLVQILATEGINLPPTVIQRGIDSYVLHMDVGSVRIETPLREMRIGAVHRGAGPLGSKGLKWKSFDGYLQQLTEEKGARIIHERVTELNWNESRPQVSTRASAPQTYDLLAVAVGVNSANIKLFQRLYVAYEPPGTTKTAIWEYRLGADTIVEYLGNSMHVFLLDIPRLEFAAIIPKGDFVTICMIGKDIDPPLVKSFLNSDEVKRCMPPNWSADGFSCHCAPRMNIQGAPMPFGDRIVFIGDSGVTRLYKDGIGGAYRTAKAAAGTAIFHGIGAEDFKRHYWPACRTLNTDNMYGKLIFTVTDLIQERRFARKALLNLTTREQSETGYRRRMSMVLWDTFTGSSPYKEIFLRTLHPAFIVQFTLALAGALWPFAAKKTQAEIRKQGGTGNGG